ncbi:phosphatidylglycerophosphatase [Sulfurirhabdus autotrophica]|uniref:Phosphatidylglycerophosphatase A n=1 Tax=Sulfurirhabdus autotrophica TaxID=1706046 RepID=A0A4R3Y5I5_9PROT|nr:phosphatidylglycerophosphatase [Sulfurirhabdus autotrophica]
MPKTPNWRFISSHPAYFLAFGFGSGLSPFAPGTAGSLAAFPLYFLLMPLLGQTMMLVALVAAFIMGIWFCDKTGRALGVADHGGIVWDEIVAFMLILLFVPQTLFWFGVAFGLFRLFDIWKPFPIRYFDTRIKNGFGVMLDDLLAAAYALIVLQGLLWLWTK